MVMSRSYALSRDEIIRALTAYTGITTADGAVTKDSLIDANLKGATDWITGKTILIDSGPSEHQEKAASAFNPGNGEITFISPCTNRIMAGTIFRLLNFSPGEPTALINAIKAQTDKLAGAAPATLGITANWNTGFATSGNPGADLVTIGAHGVKNKINSLDVNISHLTAGATVTIRMFKLVNGGERQCYNQTFVKGTDPDDLWIINGTTGIHEALRVEVYSNVPGDDLATVDYDYLLEAQ
jgi:hypothetical protein